MSEQLASWICCQLGAREHYAVPRACHQAKQLKRLITDAWVSPSTKFNPLSKISRNLQERFHPALAKAPVSAFTYSLLRFELMQRLSKPDAWDVIIARNHWFQKQAIQYFERKTSHLDDGVRPTLFIYSYAALEFLRYAKKQGWFTILGQIDPGPVEEQIVRAEQARYEELAPCWPSIPSIYWQSWQEECQLADRIVVNSTWSKELIQRAGIDTRKIAIIPLVYEPPESAINFTRYYPEQFSQQRPLKVLFLGSVTLRKGIAAVLAAIEQLSGEAVEFWLVGSPQITIPSRLLNHPQIRWISAVSRSQTHYYYQMADVFLFPTLSDGFGLTQLEAQAWQLPIVTSRFCGEVVINGVNGRILSEVSGDAIAEILHSFLNHPEQLPIFAQNAIQFSQFNLSNLYEKLQALKNSNIV